MDSSATYSGCCACSLSRRGLLRARSNLDLTLAVDEEEFEYEIRGGAFERTRFPGSRRWIRAAKAPEDE